MNEPAFTSSRSWGLWIGIAGFIVLLDQAFKQAITELMSYGAGYVVTPFFNLVHVRNPGAAFSFLADAGGWQRYALAALGVGVSVVLAWWLWRGVGSVLDAMSFTLILGGALGNVADRIARGFVVDYLDFHWQGWHWPAFNLADVSITTGAALLILSSFRSGAAPEKKSATAAQNTARDTDRRRT